MLKVSAIKCKIKKQIIKDIIHSFFPNYRTKIDKILKRRKKFEEKSLKITDDIPEESFKEESLKEQIISLILD